MTRFRALFITDCVFNEHIFYVNIQRAFLSGMTTKKFIVELFQIRMNTTPSGFLQSFEKTIYFKMLKFSVAVHSSFAGILVCRLSHCPLVFFLTSSLNCIPKPFFLGLC